MTGSPSVHRIATDADIVAARQAGRELADECGFSPGDQTVIAAAISEVARNILRYAAEGDVVLRVLHQSEAAGLEVVARDLGPGIPDIGAALTDGFSTSGGLGLGLPGAKRLMDEFDIVSTPGSGTTVTMRKWRD